MEVTGVILESVSEFGGDFPEIPLAESVLEELGSNAMFVTLPVGFSDAKSRNGRQYTPETAQAILEAINADKPIGQKGHLRADERPYRFDIPPIMWLKAEMKEGVVWAKGYILETASDVREYIRLAKINKAKVGTSIYGVANVDEKTGKVTNLQVETIDLSHPSRLGIPAAGAVPQISSETVNDGEVNDNSEETDMSENNKKTEVQTPAQTVVDESEAISTLKRTHLEEMRQRDAEIREMKNKLADYNDFLSVLEVAEGVDPVTALRALKADNSALRKEIGDLLEAEVNAAVIKAEVPESLQAVVASMVTAEKPKRKAEVTTALETVMKREIVSQLIKNTVVTESGPNQDRPVVQADPSKTAAKTSDAGIFIPGVA